MIDLDTLKFDDRGLIPAIVQDAKTGKVLTLAYMNRESLEISLKRKLTCFWSRSRQELWLKGETSGNYQHIVELRADCDKDALLEGRNNERPEGSYTTYLFEKGLDKILKKVGEECTEVIIAAKDQDHKETVYEIADLAYHVMVLMVASGITLDEIKAELASRHVIDHKVKQEKMASDFS